MDPLSLLARLWGQPDNMGGQFLAVLLTWFAWLALAVVFGGLTAADCRRPQRV